MSSAFRKSSESAQRLRDKILLWGPQFTGKTHTLLTWPDVALIDTENRASHFGERVDFLHAQAGSLEELADVFKEIKTGRVPCETIGFDSYSATYDQLVAEHTTKSDGGGYSTDYTTVNKRIAKVRDFAFSVGDKNVIFIAHAGMKYDRKGKVFTAKGEDFVGDPKFRYAFDYVFHLTPNGADPRVNPSTFLVEKSASPNLAIGQKIVGLDYQKFIALTRKQTPVGTPKGDENDPIGPDETAKIVEFAAKNSIGNMRLADLIKVASMNRTPVLRELTKGEARKLYGIMQREQSTAGVA